MTRKYLITELAHEAIDEIIDIARQKIQAGDASAEEVAAFKRLLCAYFPSPVAWNPPEAS